MRTTLFRSSYETVSGENREIRRRSEDMTLRLEDATNNQNSDCLEKMIDSYGGHGNCGLFAEPVNVVAENGETIEHRSHDGGNESFAPQEEADQSLDSVDIKHEDGDETQLMDYDSGSPSPPTQKKKRKPVTITTTVTILKGNPTRYQCNICAKTFKTPWWIQSHICTPKPKELPPFKCEFENCGKEFMKKSHLRIHIRCHTGEKPYVCVTCKRSFTCVGNLRKHEVVHSVESMFPCPHCEERFDSKVKLKHHVITHTGEAPFNCNHCGKKFAARFRLNQHMKYHENLGNSGDRKRAYPCDECNASFADKRDLARHTLIHSGELPFTCPKCGQSFRQKGTLNRHLISVHEQSQDKAKELANQAAAEYLQKKSNAD